ncbi:MAG: VOC family protein [Bacteroidales bacterium]
MGSIKGLAHIGILTTDAEQSKNFYTENLGFRFDFETILHKPDGTSKKLVFVKLNNLLVEFIEPSDKSLVNKTHGIIDHISFEVNDLDQICDLLKQNGVHFKSAKPIDLPAIYNGVKIIFFEGPNGETLELFEHLNN